MNRQRTFKYGTKEIAEATNRSQGSVRRHAREDVFDISNLWSVARYIMYTQNTKRIVK